MYFTPLSDIASKYTGETVYDVSAVSPVVYSKRILTRMYSLPVVGGVLNMLAASRRAHASVPLTVSRTVTLANDRDVPL